MKLIKLTANIIGVFALLAGVSSCKDDEVTKNECCFYTYGDLNTRISTIEACQDGILTETFDDGSTGGEDSWLDDVPTWDEMKAHMLGKGATCR